MSFLKLYQRVIELAKHRHAPVYLGALSFFEAIVLPIPADAMLIPMVLANRLKAWRFAAITTITSVLGGVVGYFIGVYLFDTIGVFVIELYGLEEDFQVLQTWYVDHGIWIVLVAGFTPIPYKIFTIASGSFSMMLTPFIITSVIGRGARFFLVSLICYWGGEALNAILIRYANIFGWIIVGVLVVVLWSQF